MEDTYLNKKPFILSIVSTKSGMGKTTLIEKLIKLFKDKNYKVGILKHDAHQFEIDKEGKDSWRFTKAGGDNVVISSSQKLAMVKQVEKEKGIEEILFLFQDVDIVIMEGFKSNAYPKIEIHRKEIDNTLLCKNKNYSIDTFMAIATNEKVEGILNLDINDVHAIADFIEEKIASTQKKKIFIRDNKTQLSSAIEIKNGIWEEKEEWIVVEYPLDLFLNEEHIATLCCTPENLKELVVGFLRTKMLIHKIEDIELLEINIEKRFAKVRAKSTSQKEKKDFIKQDVYLDYAKVYTFEEKILNYSSVFQKTGGVHCIGIFDTKDLIFACEDVARHNAMDKVMGYATLNNIPLEDKIVVVSGRISLDMLQKCANLKIPIVISKSAPTSLAIDMAKKLNITLVGFVRGKRMNIYANENRIKL